MSSNRSIKAAASRLPPGTRLNGIFEIDWRIATGGTAELYRGHAVETGDPVAIKVMCADLAGNVSALAALRKEASILYNVEHDAVVRYHVFASDPVERLHYLAMEFVDGRPLRDRLCEGPLAFEAVRALQQRLAAGLAAAHQHGIIHRDVSPDNVLLPNGDVARAKIINFGNSRSTGAGDGTIIVDSSTGKYNYLAPEQVGLFGGNVTAKTDIYSLALVLAECLSGAPIDMGGSPFEVIEKRRVLPNLGAVDLRYRPMLEHMLQPDPHDRPESMAAVAAWRPDIAYRAPPRRPTLGRGRLGRGAGGAAAGGEPARPANASGRGRLARTIAITAGVLILLAGFAGVAFFLRYSSPPTKLVTDATPAASETAPQPPAPPPLPTAASVPRAPPPLAPAPSATDANPPGGGPLGAQLTDDTARRIVRYVNSYQGGDCFFAAPVADGRAGIDVYAATVAPFAAFQSDFKRANGFDAAINPQRISQSQCAAISFLSRLRGSPGSGPHLGNIAASVRSGTALSGTVVEPGGRHVGLLLIADDGLVYNITSLLMPGAGDSRTFSLGIRLAAPGAPRPQLIIAVAGSAPLAAFKPPQTALEALGAADEVFPRAVNEARQSGQLLNASMKYFRLEN
jgi:eukaryotic-like serine/threonine-protein kinase